MASLAELIPDIFKRTKERKLEWQASSGVFVTSLGDVGLSLSRTEKGRSPATGRMILKYRLSVVDDKGNVIESTDAYPSWEAFYDAVRMNALRIDEKLDTLKKALDALK